MAAQEKSPETANENVVSPVIPGETQINADVTPDNSETLPFSASSDVGTNKPDTILQADQYRLSAQRVRVSDKGTMAEGKVQIEATDFKIYSDGVTVSPDEIVFNFVGHVEINATPLNTTATSLTVNIDTGRWAVTDARTTISPDYFGPDAQEPLFVNGQRILIPDDTGTIEAYDGHATTCDLEHPHFDIHSDHITVIPDRKVTFKRPEIFLFGHRLFKSPIDLTLRMDRKDNRIIPEIGSNEAEGLYAKLAYPYSLNDENEGLLRFHLTELRGIGLGFDHILDTEKNSANWSVLWEPAESALSSRLNWEWQSGGSWSTELNSDLQNDSGYYGNTRTLDNNLNLRRISPQANTQIGLQQSVTSSDESGTTRYAIALNHQQQINSDSTLRIRSSITSSRFIEDQPYDQELQASIDYRERRKRFDWSLAANDRFDLDNERYTADSTYRSLNKLPELLASTNEQRLGLGGFFKQWGLRIETGAGHYEQEPDDLRVNRALMKIDVGGRDWKISEKTQLRLAGRYYQAVYDEGSAQFQLGITGNLTQKINKQWQLRASYAQITPSGFAPIRLDYWGRQHDTTVQLVGLSPDKYRFDLSTGFDFLNDSWRTLQGSVEWMPSQRTKIKVQGGFDIENSIWRPIDAKFLYVSPEYLRFAVASQYNLEDSQLEQINMNLDWMLSRKTRFEVIARYSGYTKSIDDLDVRLTRDLHCWLGAVSWSKLTGDFQINLGLKAFPSIQANFGSSRGVDFQSATGSYD